MTLDRMKQYQNQGKKSTKFEKEQVIGEIKINTTLKDKWASNNGYFGKGLPKERNEKAQQRKTYRAYLANLRHSSHILSR